jgi:hypothetical protein
MIYECYKNWYILIMLLLILVFKISQYTCEANHFSTPIPSVESSNLNTNNSHQKYKINSSECTLWFDSIKNKSVNSTECSNGQQSCFSSSESACTLQVTKTIDKLDIVSHVGLYQDHSMRRVCCQFSSVPTSVKYDIIVWLVLFNFEKLVSILVEIFAE